MMLLRKPFRAQRASKRFYSTVKSVVQNHVGSVGESFLAAGLRAFVRLFPTMRSTAENKVFLCLVEQQKSSPINLLDGLPIVLLQQHLSRKLLSAVTASVWLETQMDPDVHVKRNSLVERFRTVRTKIFLLVPVTNAVH